MGWTVLYLAFGVVALWLLGEVLLQYKARLRWRLLAFVGFLCVVLGVLIPSVLVIAVGAIGFAVGQTYVTLSFRRGFSTGWALGGRPGASKRRRTGGADGGATLSVSSVESGDFAGDHAGHDDSGRGRGHDSDHDGAFGGRGQDRDQYGPGGDGTGALPPEVPYGLDPDGPQGPDGGPVGPGTGYAAPGYPDQAYAQQDQAYGQEAQFGQGPSYGQDEPYGRQEQPYAGAPAPADAYPAAAYGDQGYGDPYAAQYENGPDPYAPQQDPYGYGGGYDTSGGQQSYADPDPEDFSAFASPSAFNGSVRPGGLPAGDEPSPVYQPQPMPDDTGSYGVYSDAAYAAATGGQQTGDSWGGQGGAYGQDQVQDPSYGAGFPSPDPYGQATGPGGYDYPQEQQAPGGYGDQQGYGYDTGTHAGYGDSQGWPASPQQGAYGQADQSGYDAYQQGPAGQPQTPPGGVWVPQQRETEHYGAPLPAEQAYPYQDGDGDWDQGGQYRY